MAQQEAMVIEKVYNAPVERVWRAWVEPEQIKKWWGPHGYTAPTVKVDFRVGGTYLYCMRGPAGPGGPIVDAWSGGEFKQIVPLQKIVVSDYFADENGNKTSPETFGLSPEFPAESILTITFEEVEPGKTKLTVTYPLPESETARKAMLQSGMKEGWTQQFEKLVDLLK